MLKARASHPAFNPFAEQEIPDAPPDLFLITRKAANGTRVICATNVTSGDISFPLPPDSSGWKSLTGSAESSGDKQVFLPSYGVAWFQNS